MSDKSQNVATGAFVVGAMLIAIVTLLYLLGSGLKHTEKFVMVFDGSAKGLNIGAPLALRGVQIGQVTNVNVVLDAKTADVFVVAEAEIDKAKIHYRGDPNAVDTRDLIARGLRAQLNMQSLVTGLLYIELDFHPGSEIKYVDIDSKLPQLPTVPTSLERLAKKLEDLDLGELSDRLKRISEGVESVVDSEAFRELPGNVNSTLESLRDLSDQLQSQLASSGPRIDSVLTQSSAAIANANTELTRAVDAFQQSMDKLSGLVSDDSATVYQLNDALREVNRASRSLRQLATTLENQPEALLRGKSGDQK